MPVLMLKITFLINTKTKAGIPPFSVISKPTLQLKSVLLLLFLFIAFTVYAPFVFCWFIEYLIKKPTRFILSDYPILTVVNRFFLQHKNGKFKFLIIP